ncbi:MAG TPA: 4-hydroxythreonine-4-phosphate dehydrogenase PdxA [Polyangia bacterium]|jgi:4-hydroxythreonine-4-phosphate dehydrogenase|nr:4-hydroxythreonine-4-phosphate dehydrogenase PdxA [Polyangia bacterium]
MMTRPIGISLGDPAGIGPEVVVRALAARPDVPVRIFGDVGVLERAARLAGVEPPSAACVEPVTSLGAHEIVPGQPSVAAGRAQLAYLAAATDAAIAGAIGALVTAPISKEWIARAGFVHPGHTEYLAERAGASEFAMMLAGPRLRVVLATTHLALRDVPALLSPDDVARAAFLAADSLRRHLDIARPRIAVAGLNPHAGEAGRFGDEETRIVAPGIAAARARLTSAGIDAEVSGPAVPDAVFRQAALGGYDAVVALYHDQGLIPVKLLHFDEAVNVTLGLPFVRTSPDHGTAYDIAGTGRARADSFLAALDLAIHMAGHAA